MKKKRLEKLNNMKEKRTHNLQTVRASRQPWIANQNTEVSLTHSLSMPDIQ